MERFAVPRIDARRAIIPCAAIALVSFALAPAWLRAHGNGIAALAIFAFFSKLCHQRADRTMILFGAPAAVCIRCLGLYAGAAIGSLIRLDRKTALRCFSAGLALNCADVTAESLGLHGNMPLPRLLIGAGLGIAAGAVLSLRYVPID